MRRLASRLLRGRGAAGAHRGAPPLRSAARPAAAALVAASAAVALAAPDPRPALAPPVVVAAGAEQGAGLDAHVVAMTFNLLLVDKRLVSSTVEAQVRARA